MPFLDNAEEPVITATTVPPRAWSERGVWATTTTVFRGSDTRQGCSVAYRRRTDDDDDDVTATEPTAARRLPSPEHYRAGAHAPYYIIIIIILRVCVCVWRVWVCNRGSIIILYYTCSTLCGVDSPRLG